MKIEEAIVYLLSTSGHTAVSPEAGGFQTLVVTDMTNAKPTWSSGLYPSADIKLAGAVKNIPPSTKANAKLRPTAFQQICG